MLHRRPHIPLIAPAVAAALLAAASPARAEPEPWTFVQMPDFLNIDVGDLTDYDPTYTGPNTWNASWEQGLDDILTAVAADNPEYVMVAGDILMARWINDGHSTGGKGVFGPTRTSEAMLNDPLHVDYAATLAAERQRVDNAADFYYGKWNQLFTDKGLTVYGALGDHEIGDDPTFNDSKGGSVLGRATINTYREAYARNITDGFAGNANINVFTDLSAQHSGTVYSVKHNNVMMISVDTYRQDGYVPGTGTTAQVEDTIQWGDGQLAFIEQEMQAAAADPDIDHVILQGHSPVIYPVNSRASGGHHDINGTAGDFWQEILQEGADLYMAGEVHDVDVKRDSGLMQISNGSLIGRTDMPDQNWLVGTVYDHKIVLEIKYLELDVVGSKGSFYQVGMDGPGQTVPGSPNEFRETLIVDPDHKGVLSMGSITLDKSSGSLVYHSGAGVFSAFNDSIPTFGVTNGSFEADSTSGGTTFNADVAEWFEDEGGSSSGISTQGDSALVGGVTPGTLPDAPGGTNWLNLKLGTMAYQSIGDYRQGERYGIAFVAGDRANRQFQELTVQLWAGDGSGADGVALDTFASLVATFTVDAADFLAQGMDITDGSTHTLDIFEMLDTGTGLPEGQTLWLALSVADTVAPGTTAQHLVDLVEANLLGDADRDGVVGPADLLALAGNWGSTSADWTQGDFNRDGEADAFDLDLLRLQWGAGLGGGGGGSFESAANGGVFVPEPGALGVLLLGAIWGYCRRPSDATGRCG